jgi:predicted RNA methylase
MLTGVDYSVILDVGAGSGYFSRALLGQANAREAWCVDISYEAESDTTEAGKPLHYRQSVETVQADLVLLMDVLEHVDDDVGLLRDYVQKVPRGTFFLISVPAFKFLWSAHDVFLEHRRRYRLSQIEDVAVRAGLKVKHGAYYFGAVFPIAATVRFLQRALDNGTRPPQSQLKMHHPFVNGVLATLSEAELMFMRYNRLAGLTAFCLAESA